MGGVQRDAGLPVSGAERSSEAVSTGSRGHPVAMPSDRSFGVVFTVVFAVVGLLPMLRGDGPWLWSLGASVVVLALTLVRPRLLRPANILWFRFGLLLHRLVSPVVLGIIFFLVFTPYALLMRLVGRRPLDLAFDHEADSYWETRAPDDDAPSRMRRQF